MKIRLAELNIEVHPRYAYVGRLCADYLAEFDTPDLTVEASLEEIEAERQSSPYHPSAGYAESICIYRQIVTALPRFGAFVFHAAVWSVTGRAMPLPRKAERENPPMCRCGYGILVTGQELSTATSRFSGLWTALGAHTVRHGVGKSTGNAMLLPLWLGCVFWSAPRKTPFARWKGWRCCNVCFYRFCHPRIKRPQPHFWICCRI